MRRRTPRQQAWDKFGLPQIGRATITHYNRQIRPLRPRCSATRKNGEPCRNLALSGSSKCRCHGGATPRGDQFHKMQWPNGKAPDAERKLAAKLKRAERNRRAKERRLKAMTPEQRVAHKKWHKTHQPGPAAARARRRAERKAAAEIRAGLERADARPVSPEISALQKQAAAIEAERDWLLQQINAEPAGSVFE